MNSKDPNNNNHIFESEHADSFLLNLPDEMLKVEIAKHFSGADFISMAKSCRRFHGLFGEDRKLGLKLLQQLLNHVVRGEQEEAEQLIKLFPDLLTLKARVIDYSGRTIEGTALQIALGAEDVRYHESEECLAEMIQRYLQQLPNGEEERVKQISEQFPDGWESVEEEKTKNDLFELRKVLGAIADANSNDHCEAALNEFRNYLKPKRVIKTGKHFNNQLLIEAFKLYNENYDRFGGINSPKNNLFWCNIIGYIERFLPANYAQAFCQGIHFIIVDGEKLIRSLKFRNDNVIFFPLDSNPSFRLGYHWACARLAGVPMAFAWLDCVTGPGFNCINYLMQKTSTLREIMQQNGVKSPHYPCCA